MLLSLLFMCWCIVDRMPQWPSGHRRHWKKCARKSTLQCEFIDIGRLVRYCNMPLLPVIFVTHSHCALVILTATAGHSHLISHLSHTHSVYIHCSLSLFHELIFVIHHLLKYLLMNTFLTCNKTECVFRKYDLKLLQKNVSSN